MHDHDKARPVSGEIMSGAAGRRAGGAGVAVTDAEFETIEAVAAGAPARAQRMAGASAMRGMDFLSSKSAATPRNGASAGAGFWVSSLVIVFGAFWIAGGHSLVRQVPVPGLFEREGPLRLIDVRSRVDDGDSLPVLFVDGAIENHGKSPRVLPTLRIAVVDVAGARTSYFLGTSDSVLEPGARYDFSSRLEAPRTGVSSVSVTFQEDMR